MEKVNKDILDDLESFSTTEKESLFLFGDRFKISAEEIERIITETKNNKETSKAKSRSSKGKASTR